MRTQAIILKKIPIREYDELVVCYTRQAGKQTYQAKSVLRPTSKQAGHLDIFNLADFSLASGNGLPIVTSAYALNPFTKLKASLPALAAGYFLLECFNRLVFEGETDPKLWSFLTSQLEKQNALAQDPRAPWNQIINLSKNGFLEVMGYDSNTSLEALAGARFHSLQFARQVIKLNQYGI